MSGQAQRVGEWGAAACWVCWGCWACWGCAAGRGAGLLYIFTCLRPMHPTSHLGHVCSAVLIISLSSVAIEPRSSTYTCSLFVPASPTDEGASIVPLKSHKSPEGRNPRQPAATPWCSSSAWRAGQPRLHLWLAQHRQHMLPVHPLSCQPQAEGQALQPRYRLLQPRRQLMQLGR